MKRFKIYLDANRTYRIVEAATEEEAILLAMDEVYNEPPDWVVTDCEELTSKNDSEA